MGKIGEFQTFPPPVLTGSGSTGLQNCISATWAPRGKAALDLLQSLFKENRLRP